MKVKCTTKKWSFFTYGKEYDVIHEEDGKYYVNNDEGDESDLRYYECEVIDEDVQKPIIEPTREFKVGDKVKIVKKITMYQDIASWVPAMNMTIGLTGVVDDINHKAVGVKLEIGGWWWWYPAESLELVEEVKQEETKESPIDEHISYQEFLDAFDNDRGSVKINKGSVEILYGIDKFTCTTKEREQEVMKALIVLYGKREGKNND